MTTLQNTLTQATNKKYDNFVMDLNACDGLYAVREVYNDCKKTDNHFCIVLEECSVYVCSLFHKDVVMGQDKNECDAEQSFYKIKRYLTHLPIGLMGYTTDDMQEQHKTYGTTIPLNIIQDIISEPNNETENIIINISFIDDCFVLIFCYDEAETENSFIMEECYPRIN